MLLCKNRRLFTVAGDNSHVLTPIPVHLIPIPIQWLILHPFPLESHGIHGIPVFPIPMHTSTVQLVAIIANLVIAAVVPSNARRLKGRSYVRVCALLRGAGKTFLAFC